MTETPDAKLARVQKEAQESMAEAVIELVVVVNAQLEKSKAAGLVARGTQ